MKTFEQIMKYIDETLADESDKPTKEFYEARNAMNTYYRDLEVYLAYRDSLMQLKWWMLNDEP